jgi:phosphoadenosine phosphosulfate reductase
VNAEEVIALSAQWESAGPEELLRFAFERFPKIAISTAFGPEGCALVAMAVGLKADVPVFTIDTDFLFPESVALRERFVERYGVNLQILKGTVTIEEQNRRYGLKLYERDADMCCALRKVEPTKRALKGVDAWIAGLRRDQSRTRVDISAIELFDRADEPPVVKVNPLRNWTRQDTWRYLTEHEVPYNPLLDRGYKSIGCWPCTRPVKEGEDERAGRWGGQKAECGIHTFMSKKG